MKIELALYATGAKVSTVTLIREKETQKSRCFAFAKFVSLQDSKDWMEANFPTLVIDGIDVSVRFSRAAREQIEGWCCQNCDILNYSYRESCFKCRVPRNQASIAIGNHKISKRNGDMDVSDVPSVYLILRNLDRSLSEETLWKGLSKLEIDVQRVFMIRYKFNDAFCGYAILEFKDVDESAKALMKARTYPGKGFTLASRKVSVDYIHDGVLIPAYTESARWQFPTKTGYLVYWDPELYCSIYVPEGIDTDQFKPIEVYKKPKKEKRARSSNHIDVPASKKVATSLQRWNDAQKELKDNIPDLSEEEEKLLLHFVWKSALICVLCERKFQSWGHVVKHITQSIMHNNNLKNHELVSSAELLMHRVRQTESVDYRDRATERRIVPAASSDTIVEAKKSSQGSSFHSTSNVSMKMLNSMGWNKGSGLGTNENGIKEAIQPTMYLPGVGLGNKGSKIQINMTPVDRVKDRARSLYFQNDKNNNL